MRLHPLLLFGLACGTAAAAAPAPRLILSDAGAQRLDAPQVRALMRQQHAAGRCGGFMDITDHPLPPVATTPSPFEGRRPQQQAIVRPLLARLSKARLEATVAALSAFPSRYHDSFDGAQAALWIADAFAAAAADRDDVRVSLFHHDFMQPSVVVHLAGRGPGAAERVVLGAHADSINWEDAPPTGRAPGADDNASGVAVLLEVFTALMEADYRPERSVEFIAFAGEELGLLGSQDIAQAYRDAHVPVVGALQMDMAMFAGSGAALHFVTDWVDLPLTHFAERLVDAYLTVPWRETRCGYACSDHASWERAGYPAIFPFEADFAASNPHIHSARDTADRLDVGLGLQFARLCAAFVVEVAAET